MPQIPKNKQTYYLLLLLGQCRGLSSPQALQEKQNQEKTSLRDAEIWKKRGTISALSGASPYTDTHTLYTSHISTALCRESSWLNISKTNTYTYTQRNNSNRLCLSAWKTSPELQIWERLRWPVSRSCLPQPCPVPSKEIKGSTQVMGFGHMTASKGTRLCIGKTEPLFA